MDKVLGFANTALLVAVLALIVTVLFSYPFADHLSMSAQIAAHIGTLIFATLVKLSYILRLISLKALGRPVH